MDEGEREAQEQYREEMLDAIAEPGVQQLRMPQQNAALYMDQTSDEEWQRHLNGSEPFADGPSRDQEWFAKSIEQWHRKKIDSSCPLRPYARMYFCQSTDSYYYILTALPCPILKVTAHKLKQVSSPTRSRLRSLIQQSVQRNAEHLYQNFIFTLQQAILEAFRTHLQGVQI